MKLSRLITRRSRGFTLIEILVATMIFAIVLAAIDALFYAAIRLRNKSQQALDRALPRQRALAIMEKDIANIVPPGGILSGNFQTTLSADSLDGQVSPAFYTTTGLMNDNAPWAEVQQVTYLLLGATNANQSAGMVLYRAVRRNLLPSSVEEQPTLQRLMGGIQSVVFRYYDGTQWRDSWDSTTADPVTGQTNALPLAVDVQIQLANPRNSSPLTQEAPIELMVPIFAQGLTNTTSSTNGGPS